MEEEPLQNQPAQVRAESLSVVSLVVSCDLKTTGCTTQLEGLDHGLSLGQLALAPHASSSLCVLDDTHDFYAFLALRIRSFSIMTGPRVLPNAFLSTGILVVLVLQIAASTTAPSVTLFGIRRRPRAFFSVIFVSVNIDTASLDASIDICDDTLVALIAQLGMSTWLRIGGTSANSLVYDPDGPAGDVYVKRLFPIMSMPLQIFPFVLLTSTVPLISTIDTGLTLHACSHELMRPSCSGFHSS